MKLIDLDYLGHNFTEKAKKRTFELEAHCDKCGYGFWALLNIKEAAIYNYGKFIHYLDFDKFNFLTCNEVIIKNIIE